MPSVLPKISVLIPIFNVEKYLEECLDSVVNQTLRDIEIICINDGSTDDSLKIIKKYANNDDRIVIINKKNSGYGDSMNKGLKKATGEYVGIVESDDWIELDAFEKLYDLAIENDVDIVKSNYYNYFTDPKKARENGTITHLVHHGEVGRVIDPSDTYHIFFQRPAIWTGIYRNTFLKEKEIEFLPTAGASYQDTGFNFKLWVSTDRVYFTDEAFLHYRQDNEASSVNSPGKVYNISDEYVEIEKFLKKNDLLDTYGTRMRVAKWGAYYWNIDRLTPELAAEFIRHASKEYKADSDKGLFNFELCDTNQVRALSELINNPEMLIKRKNAEAAAKVSIIVPIYNAERYIHKGIDRILGQTLKDIEVILVDDGSTDDTADILEEYFLKDARIRLISQYNGGQSTARNRGIDVAHAEFITFADSDDYYELDALERLYKAIDENNSDVSIGSIRIVYEDKRFNSMEKNADRQYYMVKFRGTQDFTDTVIQATDVSPCNKIFRKSIIQEYKLRFPEGLRYEDAFFFYAYAWSSKTVSFLPPEEFVYNYVRRAGSTMTQTFDGTSFAYDHIEIAIRLYEFLKQNDLLEDHAGYFADIFEAYFGLSYRHMADDQKERLFNRARRFLSIEGPTLYALDDSIEAKLSKLVPPETNSTKAKRGAKSTVKRVAKKVLPILSVSYRAQRHILNAVSELHHKVDKLSTDADKKHYKLSKRVEELSEIVEKLSKSTK